MRYVCTAEMLASAPLLFLMTADTARLDVPPGSVHVASIAPVDGSQSTYSSKSDVGSADARGTPPPGGRYEERRARGHD